MCMPPCCNGSFGFRASEPRGLPASRGQPDPNPKGRAGRLPSDLDEEFCRSYLKLRLRQWQDYRSQVSP